VSTAEKGESVVTISQATWFWKNRVVVQWGDWYKNQRRVNGTTDSFPTQGIVGAEGEGGRAGNHSRAKSRVLYLRQGLTVAGSDVGGRRMGQPGDEVLETEYNTGKKSYSTGGEKEKGIENL